MSSSFATACAVVLPLLGAQAARDSKRELPVTQRAVDVVSLKSGERLLGVILAEPRGGGLKILVRREWLRANLPAFYRELDREGAARERATLEQLRERVGLWQERRQEPKTLAVFLDLELKRIEEQLRMVGKVPPEDAPDLLVIDVSAGQLLRHYAQPPDRRQILALAWEHRLANPEDKTAIALSRELESGGVDVATALPDLSDRVAVCAQDDREWAARVALTEYAYLRKPHFQGTGDLLLRADEEADRPDASVVLTKLLQEQLAGLVDPAKTKTRSSKPDEAALKTAASADFTGVRITQLEQDLTSPRVVVQDRLLARMPDGSWRAIWQHREAADTAKARPDADDAIAADPQIAKALDLLKQLGLDPDRNAIGLALRHGAATKEAQQAAEQRFEEFLRHVTRSLDAPVLWPKDATPPQRR